MEIKKVIGNSAFSIGKNKDSSYKNNQENQKKLELNFDLIDLSLDTENLSDVSSKLNLDSYLSKKIVDSFVKSFKNKLIGVEISKLEDMEYLNVKNSEQYEVLDAFYSSETDGEVGNHNDYYNYKQLSCEIVGYRNGNAIVKSNLGELILNLSGTQLPVKTVLILKKIKINEDGSNEDVGEYDQNIIDKIEKIISKLESYEYDIRYLSMRENGNILFYKNFLKNLNLNNKRKLIEKVKSQLNSDVLSIDDKFNDNYVGDLKSIKANLSMSEIKFWNHIKLNFIDEFKHKIDVRKESINGLTFAYFSIEIDNLQNIPIQKVSGTLKYNDEAVQEFDLKLYISANESIDHDLVKNIKDIFHKHTDLHQINGSVEFEIYITDDENVFKNDLDLKITI